VKRGKRATAAALICAGALALVACGGDDNGDGGDGGEPLSDQEYVAQATEICRNAQQRIEQAQQGGNTPSTPEEVESFFSDEVVPVYRDSISQLGELNPPEAKAADHDQFVADANSLGDKIESDPVAYVQQSLRGEEAPEVERLSETGQRLNIGVCFQN
jgi:hypothetical protein